MVHAMRTGAVLLAIGLLFLPNGASLSPLQNGSSWPQFHGDLTLDGIAGGSAPGGSVVYTVNLAPYVPISISNPLGNDYPYQASPSTDGSNVYVALDNEVIAVAASSGTLRWNVSLPGGSGGGPIVGTPLVSNGMVYVGQDGGPNRLAALDAGNGNLAWSMNTPGGGNPSSASVVEQGGNLVVADLAGDFAWTPESGGAAWTLPPAPANAQYFATPSFTTIAGGGPAWVVPDRGNRSLDAWSISGTPLPGFPMSGNPRMDRLYSSAALVNITPVGGIAQTWAIFGGEGGAGNPSHLYAVDLSHPSGVDALTVPAPGSGDSGIRSTPAVVVSGGTAFVYFGTRSGTVSEVEFQPSSSSTPWGWVWNESTGAPIDASPVVIGGEVIVPSEDGTVYAYRLGGGSPIWTVNTGAPVYASPAVAGGLCWVVNANGALVAIGGNGPSSGNPGTTPLGPGLSSGGMLWIVLLLVGIVVAAVIVLILVITRRTRPGPPVAPNAPPTPPGPH